MGSSPGRLGRYHPRQQMPGPPDTNPADAVDADLATFRVLCHDLRQPLVVAVGYISMLDEGTFGELSAEVHDVLHTIAGRLDAMNAIIDGSLARNRGEGAASPG